LSETGFKKKLEKRKEKIEKKERKGSLPSRTCSTRRTMSSKVQI